ncbi:MAG: hypothetical protein WCP01_16780 [Methylococcaceae bacterium]
MEITKLMGQTQTEEQRNKEREETAGLIQSFSKNAYLTELAQNNFKELTLNPAKEAEKALIGAVSYAYLLNHAPPTKEDIEQEERIRSFNESMQSLQETQERFARQQQNHKQMLIDVQVEAARIIEADKLAKQGNDNQQAIVDAGTGNHKNKKTKGETDRLRTLHFIKWVNQNYDGKQTNYFLQAVLRENKPELWGSNEETFNKWLQSNEAKPAKELLNKLKLKARQAV